jgi:NAD(P)-dependent dehydrogenase (short-subunit alcohol dehydrogenase family)
VATALITGTSTGIGRASAIQMARKGYDVFATMRDPARSTELGEVAASEGLPIKMLPLDVDRDESVDGAVREILSLAGRIDVLVNNAGVGFTGPIEETPLSEIRQVMETNFFGALRCVKAVLPSMRENGSGCIINVTSVAGRIASAAQGAYSSSRRRSNPSPATDTTISGTR